MISPKQMKILAFPYSDYDNIICDGAVRTGKTSIMFVSYIDWAMRSFDRQRFGVCGKTVDSAVKNIIDPYCAMNYAKRRYKIAFRRADKILEIRRGNTINYFEVFGGRDESSQSLIQGRTLAGCLLDEVVLMPKSFVNQAIARCSVEGSRLWFSCNPDNPRHWFHEEWIQHADEKHALYLHFTMEDNPSLSGAVRNKYRTYYSGVFYQRYVLGKWVAADGVIYDMFSTERNVYASDAELPIECRENTVPCVYGCDFGTQNPQVYLRAYRWRNRETGLMELYVDDEYYYSGRTVMQQKEPAQYVQDFEKFNAGRRYTAIIIDPSATPLKAAHRNKSHIVRDANNDVMHGIEKIATLLTTGRLHVSARCKHLIDEFQSYVWDDKALARGEEKPVKLNDHCLDSLRYVINTTFTDFEIYGYQR